MAVKRGPAKASARPAAWRWQLICAAVSVAAGACCFASGAPPLPGVYIDEAFLIAFADDIMQEQWELSPELMEQDPRLRNAFRYLCHRIPGVGEAVMEQFRVGAEGLEDPEQHDVAIRLYNTNWGKDYLAARPKLESLITYGIAIREEEFEILTKLIFQHIDRSTIRKASELSINGRKPQCRIHETATEALQRAVETHLGRSITGTSWPSARDRSYPPEDFPDGRESWINYTVHQLPKGLFEVAIESHATRDRHIERKIMLRYTGIYSWTPKTGPIQQQRFRLTEIDYPEFANYTKFPGRGKWEATRIFDDSWDENCVTVTRKKNILAYKGHCELFKTERTYTWRKGNDPRANKFRENMIGKIKHNAETTGLMPPRISILDITREKSFEDSKDEAMKVERIFDLDRIPAKLRIFYREEPLPESGIKALHFGIFINAKSLEGPSILALKPAEWSTLESTFAIEITKKVKKVPFNSRYASEKTDLIDWTTSIDLRMAAQTGPNERFLHIGKYVDGQKWEYDSVTYDDKDMTPSIRKTELRGLQMSEDPNLTKTRPQLARQLGINDPNQWLGDKADYGASGGTLRTFSGRPYDKGDLAVLGKACTGATLYLLANRILCSQAIPRHSRFSKVGEKKDCCRSTAW